MALIEIHPKQMRYIALLIPTLILLLLISACAQPTPTGVKTAPTETPPVENTTVPDSPLPPTATATPLPAVTSTIAPYVLISGNTNCRTGPGSVYDLLHTYLAGEQADLLGKNAAESFYFTTDQNGINPDCWLWGQYATPVGDTSLLPVFTPPPTPTPNPNFEITFDRNDGAAGTWHLVFQIDNTGSVPWESALMYVYDPTSYGEAGHFANNFWEFNTPGSTIDSIPVGGTAFFVSGGITNPLFTPGGGLLDFYMIICDQEYLGGSCKAKMFTIDFSS